MTDLNRAKLSRRLALLMPLAVAGCSTFDDIFGTAPKEKLPGVRITLTDDTRGLFVDNPRNLKVALPHPTTNVAWALPGGKPSHEAGHPAVADKLNDAWHESFGTSAGYRDKIPSQPVVADGRVLVMDPDGLVTAFDVNTGKEIWDFDPTPDDSRSTNIGGGVSIADGIAYIATGLAELIALDAATGKLKWRVSLAQPARSAPTIAEGRIFVAQVGNIVSAFAIADGKRIWSYSGTEAVAAMLGMPAPAYADGLLVVGFGSGEIVTLRAATGAVVWTDSLAPSRGRLASSGLSAIHGMPVIQNGRIYVVGLGGVMLSLDLRSGRRLWERTIASSETPWLAGEWLFVLSTDAQVAALNREDGSVAWVTQLQKFENMEKKKDPIYWTGPVLAGDRLIVVSGTEIAQSLSPYTGEIIGEQELSGPASLAPIVAQNTVFIITDDARLLALR